MGASEFEFGLMEGLTSVGFVASSFLMARYADRLREGQWIALGLLSFGVISAIYSRVTVIPLAIGLVMLTGFTNAPFSIARNLLVQRNTTREIRGRVNSAFSVVMSVVGLLGMAAAGLADIIDVRTMIVICAVLVGSAGLLALVLPGIGTPTAEWRSKLAILRAAPVQPAFAGVRSADVNDFNALVAFLPLIGQLEDDSKEHFIQDSTVRDVVQGNTVVRQGETGKDAYHLFHPLGRKIHLQPHHVLCP